MSFVYELLKQDSKKKDSVSVQTIIATIKSECVKHKAERKIDGFFCECSSYDGCDHYEIRPLHQRYTNAEINRIGFTNKFNPTITKQVPRFNTNHYGKEKFFFSPDEICKDNFDSEINSELKNLGFSNFAVTLVSAENEVGMLSRGLTGALKIRYEKTGEAGYLIRVQISW